MFNADHWNIASLETSGGNPFGIHISGDIPGTLEQFRIENVLVRDVNGSARNKESGLIVITPGAANTTFADVIVDGVTAHSTNQWAGILVGGDDFGGQQDSGRSTNVVIRNSTVHHVAGDGIVLFQVDNGLLENNVAYETGLASTDAVGTPNAIWTWMCGNCTMQFNEAYRTHSPSVDGGAFDIDYGCSHNTVQYNYAHDASGYCIAVFGARSATVDSVIRYNICANNGRDPGKSHQGDIYLRTWDGGVIDGIRIYDNTVYWHPAAEGYLLNAGDARMTGTRERLFKNNVLYSNASTLVRVPWRSGLDFDRNLYWYAGIGAPRWTEGRVSVESLHEWRARGHDVHGAFADSTFAVSPAELSRWPPERGFLPRPGFPAVDAGEHFREMSWIDYDGNRVSFGTRRPQAQHRGALSGQANHMRSGP